MKSFFFPPQASTNLQEHFKLMMDESWVEAEMSNPNKNLFAPNNAGIQISGMSLPQNFNSCLYQWANIAS